MSSDSHGESYVPSGLKQPYHLVDPSPWPLVGAIGGALTLSGIVFAAHFHNYLPLTLGLVIVLFTMFVWWRDVLKESGTAGLHSTIVTFGLRYGTIMFIASEVMFFVAFFWAYFHFSLFPQHVLGAETPMWPPKGTLTFDPWDLPLLNTMILLLSGTTVTWAHHALLEGDRKGLITGLAFTVFLGICFTICQAIEYSHAPFAFNGEASTRRCSSSPPASTASTSSSAPASSPSACSAPSAAASRRSAISASRRRPGTGTSSTWCGCSCSSASTGWATASSPESERAAAMVAGGPCLHLPPLWQGAALCRPAHRSRHLPGLRARPACP